MNRLDKITITLTSLLAIGSFAVGIDSIKDYTKMPQKVIIQRNKEYNPKLSEFSKGVCYLALSGACILGTRKIYEKS